MTLLVASLQRIIPPAFYRRNLPRAVRSVNSVRPLFVSPQPERLCSCLFMKPNNNATTRPIGMGAAGSTPRYQLCTLDIRLEKRSKLVAAHETSAFIGVNPCADTLLWFRDKWKTFQSNHRLLALLEALHLPHHLPYAICAHLHLIAYSITKHAALNADRKTAGCDADERPERHEWTPLRQWSVLACRAGQRSVS